MYVANSENNWFYHKGLFHNQRFSEHNKACILMGSYSVENTELLLENLFLADLSN